jgi:hypothetical protein
MPRDRRQKRLKQTDLTGATLFGDVLVLERQNGAVPPITVALGDVVSPPTPTPLNITTTTLLAGKVNEIYGGAQLAASGGSGSKTWTLESGSFPPGLSLSSAGLISQTRPTQQGTFNFTVRCTDGSGNTDTQALSIVINYETLVVSAPIFTAADVGTPWSSGLITATGGNGVYTWGVSPSLPTGFVLGSGGGFASIASGDVDASLENTSDDYIITVTSGDGQSANVSRTIAINDDPDPVVINQPPEQTATLPTLAFTGGSAGSLRYNISAYTRDLENDPYTVGIEAVGALPAGVTLVATSTQFGADFDGTNKVSPETFNYRLSMTYGALPPVSGGDYLSQVLSEGIYYGTDFNSVYVDTNADGFAEVQPSRAITSKASMINETLNQTGNGTLNPDQVDWVLDPAGSGKRVLKITNRAVDGAQGGDWSQWVNGRNSSLIRRFYTYARYYIPKDTLSYRYDMSTSSQQSLKLIKFDDPGNGQVFVSVDRFTGFLGITVNQSTIISENTGTTFASGTNPWGRTLNWISNACEDPTITGLDTGTTAQRKEKWCQRYGVLLRGFDEDSNKSATASSRYMYLRNSTEIPFGWPDSRVLDNPNVLAVPTDEWFGLTVFLNFNLNDTSKCTVMVWIHKEGAAPKLYAAFVDNVNLGAASNNNSWAYVQILNYDTERLSQTGRPDLPIYCDRVLTSTKPFILPGGYTLPANPG